MTGGRGDLTHSRHDPATNGVPVRIERDHLSTPISCLAQRYTIPFAASRAAAEAVSAVLAAYGGVDILSAQRGHDRAWRRGKQPLAGKRVSLCTLLVLDPCPVVGAYGIWQPGQWISRISLWSFVWERTSEVIVTSCVRSAYLFLLPPPAVSLLPCSLKSAESDDPDEGRLCQSLLRRAHAMFAQTLPLWMENP